MNNKKKVALIIGGSRMGEAIANMLAERNCSIVFVYRSSKKSAVDASESVRKIGQQTLILKADMSRAADAKKTIQSVIREFGRLDIVINMASDYVETPWKKLNEKSWDHLLNSNLKTAFLSILYAAPALKKAHGHVVHFSDWTAASGRPRYTNFVPYTTSKMGVLGLMQAQALELAPSVCVNAIAPGPILPPARATRKEINDVKKMTPLGKWGGVQEIVKAVDFLTTTNFVAGECLRVDGGRHLF